MTATALQNAFEKAGYNKADNAAFMAALRYVQEGGTRDRWMQIFDRAFARKRDDGAETDSKVTSKELLSPQPSPQTSGPGQLSDVSQAENARPARPSVNLYSVTERRAEAQTVLDKFKTIDGFAWGDVSMNELPQRGRDGEIAKRILAHAGAASNERGTKRVRDVVSPKTFEQIRAEVYAEWSKGNV